MAPISQDWVLTTIRNLEVVADPTNILALECALQRQRISKGEPNSSKPAHLACSHRVIRTQRYRNPSAVQHFRVFSLCSARRNTQTCRFDIEAVVQHTWFYAKSLTAFLGPDIPLRATITQPSKDSHVEALFKPLLENLRKEYANLDIGLEKVQARKTEYYRELRFQICATPRGRTEIELVDGGDSDWVHKLLDNAKERLVTRGIGSERVCQILTASP